MYVCIFDPGRGVPCETGGNARQKIRHKAILKQMVNAREYTPRGIYVALCGTNQIEATKLRVHSTNKRAGKNPLTEAEGQTRLSLPAMMNVHMGTEMISAHVLFYFFLLNIIFSVKAWCGGIDGIFLKLL